MDVPNNAENVDSTCILQVSPGRLCHPRVGKPRHVVTSGSSKCHVFFLHTIFIQHYLDLLWQDSKFGEEGIKS